MNKKFTKKSGCRAFTIVEMLVVILIIGILAGLISAASIRALHRAKVARISVEIHQLSLALHHYKTQFGEYPPDFAGLDSADNAVKTAAQNIVLRHVRKAFPRYTGDWATLVADVSAAGGPNLNNMYPGQALVFWLGGLPDATGRPSGFSKNPENPFESPATQPSRIGPFYEFDPSRLSGLSYYAPGVSKITGQPYVYFRAETAQGRPYEYYLHEPVSDTYTFKTWTSASGNTAKPYWDDRTGNWVNDTSFQILCCGLDEKFGLENVYPTGLKPAGSPGDVIGIPVPPPPALPNFDHMDDQTNFSSGTIGDDLP